VADHSCLRRQSPSTQVTSTLQWPRTLRKPTESSLNTISTRRFCCRPSGVSLLAPDSPCRGRVSAPDQPGCHATPTHRNRVCASLRQRLVVLVRATTVGVPLNQNLRVRIGAQITRQAIEREVSPRLQRRLAVSNNTSPSVTTTRDPSAWLAGRRAVAERWRAEPESPPSGPARSGPRGIALHENLVPILLRTRNFLPE